MLDAHDILNSLSELIYISDSETKEIIYLNKPAAELLGGCEGKTRDEALEGKLSLQKDGTGAARIYTGVNGTAYVMRAENAVINGRSVVIETAAAVDKCANSDEHTAVFTPERIKKLIDEERFVIWFQPRFTADKCEFCGSEALIRFFDEDDIVISPMDFIPEMEKNDTIHLIDLYVFRHVCEYLSGWIANGRNVKPVSLNMSYSTLTKPNIIENLMEIWYDYNIPKELIIIEVSENQSKGGLSDIADVLTELKKCGFLLAVDNFGSRHADLYLFADLKFDILKLDVDMVYKMETDKKTQLLSMSVMQICHNENIKITAGGVENERELEILREIGCDEVQGYLFDKPMSWNWFEQKYL